jgi:phage tail sheath protein FI
MSGFQVSPGVQVKEIDLTNVVPAVSTSVGGYAGDFAWGPVDEVTLVVSEKDLVAKFGKPSTSKVSDFMAATSFLNYSNALRLVRAIDTNASNANTDSATTKVVVKQLDDYDSQYGSFAGDVTVTISADISSGVTEVTVDDATGVTVGDVITGAEFAADTTITEIVGNVLTLSSATTGDIEGLTTSVDYVVSFNKGTFAAKYPGVLGNALGIQLCSSSAAFDTWQYAGQFAGAPNTTPYTLSRGGSDDELHVVVIDVTGEFTGTAGTVLESFGFLSQARDAKSGDGTTVYYKDVLARSSKFVWLLNHPEALTNAGKVGAGTTFVTEMTPASFVFSGGNDSVDTGAATILAYDLFLDVETIEISLLFQGSNAADTTTLSEALINIAEQRKDCVAFISPPLSATVGTSTPAVDVKAWADTITSTSYAVMDSSALKVYDKYNDRFIWLQAAGSIAGLCANTDNIADPWFSPAGLNRGQLRSVVKLAFTPNKAQRDDLYQARVNPLVAFPGEGILLYGDKTALAKPSAFDRINVRRLFIVMEKAIATAAKFQLFEQNDAFTRAQFRNLVEPFLRSVQGRRGITEFAVICDETNNDGQVIDSNNFVADIYVKPTRSINFINLNFIATRSGIEFSEIIGQ